MTTEEHALMASLLRNGLLSLEEARFAIPAHLAIRKDFNAAFFTGSGDERHFFSLHTQENAMCGPPPPAPRGRPAGTWEMRAHLFSHAPWEGYARA